MFAIDFKTAGRSRHIIDHFDGLSLKTNVVDVKELSFTGANLFSNIKNYFRIILQSFFESILSNNIIAYFYFIQTTASLSCILGLRLFVLTGN